jgi:hypothetical protein
MTAKLLNRVGHLSFCKEIGSVFEILDKIKQLSAKLKILAFILLKEIIESSSSRPSTSSSSATASPASSTSASTALA